MTLSGPGSERARPLGASATNPKRLAGWRRALWPAAVFVLALALRVWFIAAAAVDHPLRRTDALEYLQYALNLVELHVYSGSHQSEGPVTPDGFRDPGYPVFLAAWLLPLGFTPAWYAAVLFSQAVLGAVTAALTTLVARYWLPPAWAVAAGLTLALWPHNVAISGFVLSETLFGFALMLAVWLSCRAFRLGAAWRWFGAGLAFGLAAMVNATVTPFCALLAALLWRRTPAPRRWVLALLLGSLLLPGAWAARNASLQGDRTPASRAMQNLVQGSWPEYHDTYTGLLDHDPAALATGRAITDEQRLMARSPAEGLAAIGARLREQPLHYLSWYAWKPALLWAWSIRMGWGDIYPYPVSHSIYLSNPVMRLVEALCFALNPLLFVLMAAAILGLLLRPPRQPGAEVLRLIALLVVCETLIYSVLQSEPRYSIPLRPLEMMLAATAVRGGLLLWRTRSAMPMRPAVPDDIQA